ncbi:hypothetical protein RHSIM_Rhsim04G0077900 [Rhododendron simsii]|uniref:RNase H type-1 domain-containing protein n=1 Tax=Rhododendron simsii TaxID=118357 RepID=A0A834LSF8_RHOSS|nr:hypothetical protein RHSIM_Rhsim04G0077900 [Rhododendron simsii]
MVGMRLWQWWRGIGKEINLIDGAVGAVKISSPFQGELMAIRKACEMAKALGLQKAVIKSDNQHHQVECVRISPTFGSPGDCGGC